MSNLAERLHDADYLARPAELLALRAVEAAHQGPASALRALLLEGAPGCGKTALAEAYAKACGARYVYALLHQWTDDQELFRGVNVVAAVAGDAARVEQPGVLAVAAQASLEGPTVLCLDEVDKCQERTEGLLLDVLQTGRVPVRPGEYLQADAARLVVFVTSNGQRPLGDAFLRRVRRVRMQPLPVDTADKLVMARAAVPAGIAKLASKAARAVALGEGTEALSVQEIAHFAADVWRVAESADDVRLLLAQWAARTDRGAALAQKADIAPLWGEVVAARRRAP